MKNKHMTEPNRHYIAIALTEGKSLSQIAADLEKSLSTVSREIRQHLTIRRSGGSGSPFNECVKRINCQIRSLCKGCSSGKCRHCKKLCNTLCREFSAEKCERLRKPPYVCNGCPKRGVCTLEKRYYDAATAQKEYAALWSESHKGISLTAHEVQRIDRIVTPLMKQGQSVNCIMASHKMSPLFKNAQNIHPFRPRG